jgi:hypothetical protein
VSPVAPPRVLPPRDIVRFLRLIGSPACRGAERVPLSIIANLTGLSRMTLYGARDGGPVSEDVAELTHADRARLRGWQASIPPFEPA